MTKGTGSKGVAQTLARAGLPALLCWSLLPLTYFFQRIDSTREPFFDLTSGLGVLAYWISESGGTTGIAVLSLLMLLLLTTRTGLSGSQRSKEAMLVVFVILIFAGLGSYLNEHVIKAALKIPRPNIEWLASADGEQALGMQVDAFYESGDKAARREPLRVALHVSPAPVALAPEVLEHWVHETGYSFPSGHSYAAMFIATFFLLMAATYLKTSRIWFFYLLLPWAAAVCYSRLILRVHTPTDITVGGLEGLIIGFVAWFLVTRISGKNTLVAQPG